MVKLNTLWTYRISTKPTRFGLSLQVYNQRLNEWVHMDYVQFTDFTNAAARYRETMRYAGFPHHYNQFTPGNLLELARVVEQYPNPEISDMLAAVCHILDTELEVIDVQPAKSA